MNIFKRNYTLRRFSQQSTKMGYAVVASYKDETVSLNVQPTVSADLKSLPEGDRASKSIKSYGDFPVTTVDVRKGIRADRLYYAGEWYECVGSFYTNIRRSDIGNRCTSGYRKPMTRTNRLRR